MEKKVAKSGDANAMKMVDTNAMKGAMANELLKTEFAQEYSLDTAHKAAKKNVKKAEKSKKAEKTSK